MTASINGAQDDDGSRRPRCAIWLAVGDATEATDASSDAPSIARRLLPKLVLSLFLGALFAWLVARGGVPLVPEREAFDSVAWWTVGAYVGTLAITHFLRASRWRFLIAPIKKLPFREVILLNWIGFFAIFALPLRLGEMARPALTKLRADVPVSVGFGTVAVERVIDGLITSVCVAWAVFALPQLATDDPIAKALPVYAYSALTVFISAFIALAVFLSARDWATRMTERIVGLVSPKLGSLLAEKVGGVADGIRSLTDVKLTAGFLFESALYWAFNAGGMCLLGWGCGLPMGPGHGVALMGILAIGILLPTGPGLFGNFQLAMSSGMKLYFAASLVGVQGSVYIFLLYGIQAIFICACGIIPLYAMKISLSDLLGTEQVKKGLHRDDEPSPSS